jgi:hypothetical protein
VQALSGISFINGSLLILFKHNQAIIDRLHGSLYAIVYFHFAQNMAHMCGNGAVADGKLLGNLPICVPLGYLFQNSQFPFR